MPESPFLAAAAESLENMATAFSSSGVRARPQAAGALLRACVKMGVAAEEAGLEQLAEECRDTADEAAEVTRLASDFKEIMSFQPRRGWLRRFGSSFGSRTPTPRPTSGELQVDCIYFALSGAINLLPYMGRTGLLKDTAVYDDNYLWWISVLFSAVWGALGVSLHAQERGHGLGFGRLCRHAATLGLTVLVCLFCSWISPASSTMLTVMCVVFAIAHALLWLAPLCKGRGRS
ncbi:unnamed protein product [Urochloa humidicola]